VVKQCQHHFIIIKIIFARIHPDVLWNINITKQYTSNKPIYYTSWLHVSTAIGSSSGLLLNHVIKTLRTLLGSKLMFTKTLIGIPGRRRKEFPMLGYISWILYKHNTGCPVSLEAHGKTTKTSCIYRLWSACPPLRLAHKYRHSHDK